MDNARRFADRVHKQKLQLASIDNEITSVKSLVRTAEVRTELTTQKAWCVVVVTTASSLCPLAFSVSNWRLWRRDRRCRRHSSRNRAAPPSHRTRQTSPSAPADSIASLISTPGVRLPNPLQPFLSRLKRRRRITSLSCPGTLIVVSDFLRLGLHLSMGLISVNRSRLSFEKAPSASVRQVPPANSTTVFLFGQCTAIIKHF